MTETDSGLVARTLGGDNSAFDCLVDRHRTRVLRMAIGRVGAREDAVDIAQDAFVRAYLSLGTLRDHHRFAPWLMAIVGNLCRMHMRELREVVVPTDAIDDNYAARDEVESNHPADHLDRLPEATRVAARLYFVEGLKQTEIAARLGITLGAVKARVREARKRLQKEMVDMAPGSKPTDVSAQSFADEVKRKIELARWYRTIAEHCSSGGNVMTGLEAIRSGDFSADLIYATQRVIEAVQAGRPVTDALAEVPAFDSPQTLAMMRAGELHGSLHIAARVVADWLETQNAQREIELVFWCRTFGFLLGAGAPLQDILNYELGATHGKALLQATREIIHVIEQQGEQGAESLLRPVLERYADVLPALLRVALLLGEKTGKLERAFWWAADEIADDLARHVASNVIPVPRDLTPRASDLAENSVLMRGAVDLLLDPAPDIRLAAIDVLGRIAHTEAAQEVVARLNDDSAEVRTMAARVVADLGCKDAASALTKRLADPDPLTRRTAIESLVRLDAHDASGAIADAIRDADLRVVIAAIEALQALGELEVLERRSVEMLYSEALEDRQRAAYVLRYYLPREVAMGIAEELGARPDLSPAETDAAIALGLYGCEEARPILNRLLGDPRVSNRAARALRDIGDAESAAAIRGAIRAGRLQPECSVFADAIEAR